MDFAQEIIAATRPGKGSSARDYDMSEPLISRESRSELHAPRSEGTASGPFDPTFGPPVLLERQRAAPIEWDPFFGPPVVKGQFPDKNWTRPAGSTVPPSFHELHGAVPSDVVVPLRGKEE